MSHTPHAPHTSSSPHRSPHRSPPRAVARRRALAWVAGAAALLSSAARPLAAQVFTLPTVRAGEPPIEERTFFRILRELRRELTPDLAPLVADTARLTAALAGPARDSSLERARETLAAARARVRRFTPVIDSLLLAALDGDQPDRLVKARTHADTLLALAGGKYDTTEVEVRMLDAALASHVRAQLAAGRARDSIRVPAIRERDARRLLQGARRLGELTALQEAQVDSLTRLATTLIIYRKLDERDGWLPVHDRAQAEVFWGQRGFAPLNVGAVAVSPSGGVAYTELAAPILQFLRLSVSAVVAENGGGKSEGAAGGGAGGRAAAADESSDAALQRFVSGGGLVNLSAAYPLYHGPGEGRESALTLLVVPRLGFTAPALGAQRADTTTLALDTGLELHGKFLDLTGGVGLTGQLRWGHAVGSRHWGESVGLSSNRLTYATAGFGVVFARQYQFTFNRVIGGPRGVRKPDWTVGLTAVRLPNP